MFVRHQAQGNFTSSKLNEDTQSSPGTVSMTLRVPTDIALWIQEEAKAQNKTQNQLCRELFDDARAWYQLPQKMVERLENDRIETKTPNMREYIRNLLVEHFSNLVNLK